MNLLANQHCVPCTKKTAPATASERRELMRQLPRWKIKRQDNAPTLVRVYDFNDYDGPLAFAIKIARAANRENHHPSILLEWGRVTVGWSTHAIHNLQRGDFIMAAKTDALYSKHS